MSSVTEEFQDEINYEKHFKNPTVIFIASAGDRCIGVNWPSVSQNVLSVGGTTLQLDSFRNLIGTETAWSGSDGGISNYINEPEYQKNYNIITGNHRAVPGVSFEADPMTGVAVYCSTEFKKESG